jgi:rSAM/selenodomain-associated transferase 2
MKLSVIIPVYREPGIGALLDDLRARSDAGDLEIIVVDGAPQADTLALIPEAQALRLHSPPGRGVQLAAGAARAHGDVLLFLHADTRLPENAFTLIRLAMADQSLSGGAFSLRYAEPSSGLSFIATAANIRSGLTRVPYGDQAIFVRRTVVRDVGGIRPLPIMEDLEFMARLRRAGHRIRILPVPVLTSGRRQLREGIARCTLRNLLLRLLYHCGVPASCLTGLYRRNGK